MENFLKPSVIPKFTNVFIQDENHLKFNSVFKGKKNKFITIAAGHLKQDKQTNKQTNRQGDSEEITERNI